MTANEYQKLAMRTERGMRLNDASVNYRLMNGLLGLCGEAGECSDLYKKALFQGHELDKEHFIKELGDVCWYIALCADAMDVTLEDVMAKNIDKLNARYPGGLFDVEHSLHRAEGDI